MTQWRWHGGLGIALVLLALDAPQTWACERWTCGNGRYAYRPAPWAHGYGSPARTYRYRSWAWAYGYTNPARIEGYPYAAWSSISIPPTRSYLNTASPPPDARAVGLTMPVTSGLGLLETGLPGRGPSLFGPPPRAPAARGYYYSSPYAGPAYAAPPPDTASWWAPPRRR